MIVPIENVVAFDGLGYSLPQLTWINELLVAYGPLQASGFTVGNSILVAPAKLPAISVAVWCA